MPNGAPQLQPPVILTRDERTASSHGFLHAGSSWGVSAAIHMLIVAALLLWTIPHVQSGSLQIAAWIGRDDGPEDDLVFALEPPPVATEATTADEPLPTLVESKLFSDGIEVNLVDPASAELAASTPVEFADDSLARAVDAPKEASAVPRAAASVTGATSVEQALDQITAGLRGQLEQGDLLVVWLLDASMSLKDDRQRVADRLKGFLQDIAAEQQNPSSHQLHNAVVAFGRGLDERVAPTRSIHSVLDAINSTPLDLTGDEKTFVAIERCVARYRRHWKSQMVLVVWTDESGDDANRLEQTIKICARNDVSVSVVGPSAVLGADTGLHAYTDPQSQLVYQLPVTRGPDSAMSERLRLGYWFASVPGIAVPRASVSPYPSWYGGPDLAGITSGFSPHALTRLTQLTGGTYTLFDRAEDRGPFDLGRMEKYFPAYDSVVEYERELALHPLRIAVMRAVEVTHSNDIGVPDYLLFGQRSPRPPFMIEAIYLTPQQFQSRLKQERGKLFRGIEHASTAIERALSELGRDGRADQGLDDEWEAETSPRWRAWYDLTRGRLLAASVRWAGYRVACDELYARDFLQSDTNGIMFLPSPRLTIESPLTHRAEEAEQLLSRCVKDHADTPWAYLAQREMAHHLGVDIRQLQLRPTSEFSEAAPTLPNY